MIIQRHCDLILRKHTCNNGYTKVFHSSALTQICKSAQAAIILEHVYLTKIHSSTAIYITACITLLFRMIRKELMYSS